MGGGGEIGGRGGGGVGGDEVIEWSKAVLKNSNTLEHACTMAKYTEPAQSCGYH